jgi:hypothetical protein
LFLGLLGATILMLSGTISCGEPDRKEASKALTSAYNAEQSELKGYATAQSPARYGLYADTVARFNHRVLDIAFPSDVKGDVDNLIRIDNDFIAAARTAATKPATPAERNNLIAVVVQRSAEQDAAYQILKKDLDR